MVDGHNPANDVIVLQNGTNVDVYLKLAQLTIKKVDWTDTPLTGSTFTLERLKLRDGTAADAGETMLVDADGDGTPEQYVLDDSFPATTATSDAEGNAVFYNLAADEPQVYRVRETGWPAGYAPIKEPVYVVVYQSDAQGDPVYQVVYTIKNNGVAELPRTGVFGGTYVPLLVGGALLGAVAVVALLHGGARKGRDA